MINSKIKLDLSKVIDENKIFFSIIHILLAKISIQFERFKSNNLQDINQINEEEAIFTTKRRASFNKNPGNLFHNLLFSDIVIDKSNLLSPG